MTRAELMLIVGTLATAFAVDALGETRVERLFRPERYSRGDTNVLPQQDIDYASWIWMDGLDIWGAALFSDTRPTWLENVPSYFVKFRKDFEAIDGEDLEIDVSADERYILVLDGKEISRGPNRGLANRWHYHSYRISGLKAGQHCLEAICWQLGEHSPLAQVSIRGGFILKASGGYDAVLTTGKAEWNVGRLYNTRMTKKANPAMFGVGSCCEVTGTSFFEEEPKQWSVAKVVRGPIKTWAGLTVQGWLLFPTELKDMMFERKTPGKIVRGENLLASGTKVIPARTKVEAIWDLGNYYCAYPFVKASGGKGSKITWMWSECLTDKSGRKDDRGAFEGLDVFDNIGDVFISDGRKGAVFTTPWWRCGKWCKLVVETGDEPLAIDGIEFAETRYPTKLEAKFECDDPFVAQIQPLCERVLQMCMHEMFFDCPYYEQQMYPGDSRVQYLVAGLFDLEDRMVRNAITLYDTDRRENGMISMNCPTRGTQEALGFTTCETIMHGDYAMNHQNRKWLKTRLVGLNHTLMCFDEFTLENGLLGKTPGWNFVDWTKEWAPDGVPMDGDSERPNAEMNLQYLYALKNTVIAEKAVGEKQLADYWRAKAEKLSAAIKETFWCPENALFASTIDKKQFSEHSQCLALMTDVVTGEEAKACFNALITEPNLVRGTIYYKHYLFEAFFKFGRADLFFKNLGFWHDCVDWHLATILETPGKDSRSDCHGWGSNPLWHLHTGVAGVRSAAPFYGKVRVAPCPGHLKWIRSETPVPQGLVKLDLSFTDGKATGTITLPKNLEGTFVWAGRERALKEGVNTID